MDSRADEVFADLKAQAEALGPEVMQPNGRLRQRDGYDMLELACKRIAEMEAERRWIPVGERLPGEGGEVLVSGITDGDRWRETAITFRRLDGTVSFAVHGGGADSITHWMPLPPGPEVTYGE